MRSLLVLLLTLLGCLAAFADEEMEGAGSNQMRIEVEDKLFVPQDKVDETFAFLQKRLLDQQYLDELGPGFTSSLSVEEFWDTYFDTSSLQMHARQSGIRHRRRVNLSDPTDRKSGRELMQIKVNQIDPNNPQARGELKYHIERPLQISSPEDSHPFLGLVKPSEREALKSEMAAQGLDPYDVRPVLTVHDIRSRVYILQDKKPFISVSFDKVDVSMWWTTVRFSEIEPENNEIAYTMADETQREYMRMINKKIVDELRGGCPWLVQDLTPKYNKSFDRLSQSLPFFPALVKARLNNQDSFVLVCLASAALLGGLLVLVIRRLRRRAR